MPISTSTKPDGGSGAATVRALGLFLTLTGVQLTSYRWAWKSLLLTGLALPCLGLYGAVVLLGPGRDPALEGHILAGNVLMSFFLPLVANTSSRLCFLKLTGALDFYKLAPVPRWVFLCSIVAAFFVLAMPGMLLVTLVNRLYLHVPLHPAVTGLVAAPCAALAFGGLGLSIGALARTPDQANALSHLTSGLLLVLAPIIVPLERLPAVLYYTRYLVPSHYAARAMHLTLLGQAGAPGELAWALCALLAFGTAGVWLAQRSVEAA